jgi:hypothetical protein
MSTIFALVLFGCTDDGTACRRLATQAEQYSAQALCEAAQDNALQSEVALRSDYPTVVSRCLRVEAALLSGQRGVHLAVRHR